MRLSHFDSYQHSTAHPHDTVITRDEQQQDQQQQQQQQPHRRRSPSLVPEASRRAMTKSVKAIAIAFGCLVVAASTRIPFSSFSEYGGDAGRTMAALIASTSTRTSTKRHSHCRISSSVIVDTNGIIENGPGSDGSCNDTVHWYHDQLVDHFLNHDDDDDDDDDETESEQEAASNNNKWSQKYFINDDYFRGPGHPIFYIMGGEDQADCLFYPFITHNLARIFGGLTLEAEHRFYGDSQPIQNRDTNVRGMVGLLTVEQTMEDFLRLRMYPKRIGNQIFRLLANRAH